MKLEKAIEGIQKYRELIHKENMWNDPMALSDTMTKLAVYNAYLADNIAPLHKQATDKAYSVYMSKRKAGETASLADQASRGESTEERMLYENVVNIHKSTKDMVSVLQSRLRTTSDSIKQEGIDGA